MEWEIYNSNKQKIISIQLMEVVCLACCAVSNYFVYLCLLRCHCHFYALNMKDDEHRPKGESVRYWEGLTLCNMHNGKYGMDQQLYMLHIGDDS